MILMMMFMMMSIIYQSLVTSGRRTYSMLVGIRFSFADSVRMKLLQLSYRWQQNLDEKVSVHKVTTIEEYVLGISLYSSMRHNVVLVAADK